jgi:hypothetical protein
MMGSYPVGRLQLLAALGLLTACGQQASPPVAKPAQSEIDEVHALVQAVKNNPSVKDSSKAGPPIHVDAYPKSAGASHSGQMPMNNSSH